MNKKTYSEEQVLTLIQMSMTYMSQATTLALKDKDDRALGTIANNTVSVAQHILDSYNAGFDSVSNVVCIGTFKENSN